LDREGDNMKSQVIQLNSFLDGKPEIQTYFKQGRKLKKIQKIDVAGKDQIIFSKTGGECNGPY
jgi:hypothetical protein